MHGRRRRVDEEQRPLGGDHARNIFEVLDEHGNTCERAGVSAGRHGSVHLRGYSLCLIVTPGDDGVERAVVLVDTAVGLCHQLGGTDASAAHGIGQTCDLP